MFDKDDIALLRRFAGSYFTPANGYDFRKKLSRSKQKTALKYIDNIHRLIDGGNFTTVKPAKGEKKALYEYTGQGLKFDVAIVQKPQGAKKAFVKIDKTQPRFRQVSIQYPDIFKKEIKIPKEHILYFINNEMWEELEDYLREVAAGAEIFLINTINGSMWTKATNSIQKLIEFCKEQSVKYGSSNFGRGDYSFFDNWIESITVFFDYTEAERVIEQGLRAREKTRIKFWGENRPFEMRYSSKRKGFFKVSESEFDFYSKDELKAMERIVKKHKRAYQNEKSKKKKASKNK